MANNYFVAKPWSIKSIRVVAKHVRESLNLTDEDFVDFRYILDLMSILYKDYNFNYIVLPDNNKRFKSNEEAHTDISKGTIYIKESVYKDLENPSSRSHFTIAHEVGHYFFHHLFGPVMSRNIRPDKIYEDPEWQADQFAAELLMPYNLVKNLGVEEIYRRCNVSFAAAKVRYQKLNKKIKAWKMRQHFQACRDKHHHA